MSIHLEHGYRLPALTLPAFHELVMTYRASVQAWARTAYQRQAAVMAYRFADATLTASSWAACLDAVQSAFVTTPDPESWARTPLRVLIQDLIADHQHAIHRHQQRDPDYDWDCALSVFPQRRTGIYVLLWAEPAMYHTLWQALPGVTSYGYQNATDRPDAVSIAQWHRRKARWDAVLQDAPPDQHGMTVTVYDPMQDWENRFWTVDPAVQPAWATRVSQAAFDQVYLRRWQAHEQAACAANDPSAFVWDLVWDTHRWVQTPTGADALAAEQALWRTRLPQMWPDTTWTHTLADLWDTRPTP